MLPDRATGFARWGGAKRSLMHLLEEHPGMLKGGNQVSVPDAPNRKSQLARKIRLSRHLKPGTTTPPVNTSIGRVSASMESAV